jgi:hypothetical protein
MKLMILVINTLLIYQAIQSQVETFVQKCKDKNEVNCENKVTYRITAIYTNETTQQNSHDIFSLTSLPINKCKSEDCEFCCLSTNKCGTKIQCENSHVLKNFFNVLFFVLVGVLVAAFIVKCYHIDSQPEQLKSDKIENLNELISLFGLIKNNRKKIIA